MLFSSVLLFNIFCSHSLVIRCLFYLSCWFTFANIMSALRLGWSFQIFCEDVLPFNFVNNILSKTKADSDHMIIPLNKNEIGNPLTHYIPLNRCQSDVPPAGKMLYHWAPLCIAVTRSLHKGLSCVVQTAIPMTQPCLSPLRNIYFCSWSSD